MQSDYLLSQLDVLEAESIHIMREVAAEFERPALLFSGGKDSIVVLALAEKAFRPANIPFPVMHVDTGHNFPEVLDFRDKRAAELGVRLVVASVQERPRAPAANHFAPKPVSRTSRPTAASMYRYCAVRMGTPISETATAARRLRLGTPSASCRSVAGRRCKNEAYQRIPSRMQSR